MSDDNNPAHPWQTVEELHANRDYWQNAAHKAQEDADYYREQLAASHALLGRVVHQASERWDTVRLTKHYPTDNLHGQRGKRQGDES